MCPTETLLSPPGGHPRGFLGVVDNRSLTALKLDANDIGDKGAEALATLLERTTTLGGAVL